MLPKARRVVGFQRIGKRIVFELEDELFLVFHLMITGRFHWKKRGIAVPRKYGHAAFDFPMATLLLDRDGHQEAGVAASGPGPRATPRA